MAFATAATLETQYAIDYNDPGRNLDLSEAYLDYKVWSWTNANVLNLFNNNFSVPEASAGNFSGRCDSELDCPLRPAAKSCINSGQCFQVIDSLNETTQQWIYSVECVPCNSGMKRVKAKEVVQVNDQINSVDQFKTMLMEGPMILRVSASKVTTLQNYSYGNAANLSYHAVSLIGWKEVNGGIKLHFKDSWIGNVGFKYSKVLTHSQLLNLLEPIPNADPHYRLFQIKGTKVVNEFARPVNYDLFVPADQCIPTPPAQPGLTLLNEPVLLRNVPNVLYASISCNGEPAVDWEWIIPNSAVYSPANNNCNSTVSFTTNTSTSSLLVKVRAKSISGAWSVWKERSFAIGGNAK
ncbi:MAG: hypothetical protein Roseis2KO_03040 [Roseivirga sp.]